MSGWKFPSHTPFPPQINIAEILLNVDETTIIIPYAWFTCNIYNPPETGVLELTMCIFESSIITNFGEGGSYLNSILYCKPAFYIKKDNQGNKQTRTKERQKGNTTRVSVWFDPLSLS